ncbi:MAG: PIN domain-containing protein [Abditibacteriales bacterium]|nr:PIN domain-containing protein [Abditibacteriales bacterium]MDW8365465.1 PIN domain-containing protein [Abditibacteriales bacterium]
MTKPDDALAGVTRLGFDTAPIIYFVEAHPQYDALVVELFQRVADGILTGFTSAIALTEVLVHPLRHGDAHLQQQYRDLLLNSDNFETRSVDPHAAQCAADLRARYNLRTPDALQIAAAMDAGCEAFLTSDATLQRITELRVLVSDDLEL